MRTLRNIDHRAMLAKRIEAIKGDEKPIWGKMNVEQMLSHLVQTGSMPFEKQADDRSNWFARTMVKPLMLYVLPMPKEIPIGPDVDQQKDGRKPLGVETDKQLILESIERLGTLDKNEKCLDHPFFGRMSASDWCLIGHKHIDHHLRQFGL